MDSSFWDFLTVDEHDASPSLPEKRIWMAVLINALVGLQEDLKKVKSLEVCKHLDDGKWVFSDEDHPTSFLWVCELLELPAWRVRNLIAQDHGFVRSARLKLQALREVPDDES